MPDVKPRFSFTPVRRALEAEKVRAARDQHGGPIYEVKVTAVVAGDYHRVGDYVILEMAR